MNFQERIDNFDSQFYSGKLALLIYLSIFLLSLLLRVYLALQLKNPGHGDPAYYLSLAQNLADGRGFVIDYVWHFLTLPENLTHYSNDFWMPLTSVIISGFLCIFGKSMIAALIPSIIFGLGLSVLTYFIAGEYTKSKAVSYWSAVIVLFAPALLIYSITTDSSIYYAVFIAAGILMIKKASNNSRFYVMAALLAGLGQLARQDGILMMFLVIVSIIFSLSSTKQKIRLLLMSVAVYLLVLSPFFAANLIFAGKLTVSKTFKIAFVTAHDDIYSFAKDLSLRSYLDWGLGNIAAHKIGGVVTAFIEVLKSFGRELLLIPLLSFLYVVFFKKTGFNWREFKTPLAFMALLLVFYIGIASFPTQGGALFRSAMALVPFGIVMAVRAVPGFCRNKIISYIVLFVITGLAIFGSIRLSNHLIGLNNNIQNDLSKVALAIQEKHDSDDEIVIMTRDPWEVNFTTGYRSVQIPNDDLETIYFIARKYKANYLLLPAPREALAYIYESNVIDPRFIYFEDVPETRYKIYKIITN